MQLAVRRMATVIALVAVVAFALPLGVLSLRLQRDVALADLDGVQRAAAAGVSVDAVRGDPVELPTHDGGTTITVVGAGGRLLAGDRPAGIDSVVAAGFAGSSTRHQVGGTFTGGRLEVAAPVLDGERVIAVVVARAGTAGLARDVATGWGAMAALAGVVVASAWLGARRWGRRLTQPLRVLGEQAHAIGAGELTTRASPSAYPEIAAVAEALNASSARLQGILQRQQQLTVAASHQLRTPLAGLRLTLDVALATPGADLRSAVGASLAAADRLEATVADVLLLARDENSASAATADVTAVLHSLHEERAGSLALAGRTLRVHRTSPTPPVAVSPQVLRQVLAVMLDNATEHGVGTTTIDVTPTGGVVLLSVVNAVRPGGPARSGGGSGLHLAVALAESSGARLESTSSQGRWRSVLVLRLA